ncbi:MAG: hypothetical protein AAB373_05305 [Patescibacteria group bacterium]
MKMFYLTGSLVFTVLILILAFENIGATCSFLNFFFYEVEQSPTLVILGISVIGILTGILYHAAFQKMMGSKEEEDQNF